MIFYRKFLFFVFLYSISNDKWFLVESTDLSAGSTPGSGADTNESQPASATPPSGGTTVKSDQDATSTPPASTNEGQQASGTPTSGGTTPGADTGSGTKTGVELSLKATASTDQFDHNKNNKIVTYTAKDTYGFKSVKTGDTVVWSTSNANEYASKVVLDGKGQKKKTVTIHMLNGTTKSYRRESKGKPWIEGSHLAKDPSKTASKPRKNVTQEDVNWALNRRLKGGI